MPKFAITLSRTFEHTARVIIKAADANSAFELMSELNLDHLELDWHEEQIGETYFRGSKPLITRGKVTSDVQRHIDAIEAKWAALEKKEKEKHERAARRTRTRVRR